MSVDAPLRLAVILGSNREGRFGPIVARWFTRFAEQRGDFKIDFIDLGDLGEHPLPAIMGGTHAPEQAAVLADLTARLADAEAFVVVTPEYNHSFPAALKHAIDLHNVQWHAKPVGFVSYGGLGGGLRAVEQLRLIFAELHAMTVRDSVSFHSVWERFDAQGELVDSTVAEGAATGMLNQLTWWGEALRQARAEQPYGK
ncbi:NAD(P)H-dependent FMN reductase [Kitasatospora sp. MAA4]|uniref:NADPH-dependent FMN reductase n=1 Tax=Kitasatospora sp. MAA4 TaxID=3035093 RepID=UPI002474C4ED|nr:NAD(P)H-dependent oxidoreductase [Kitasatospora sp. MAA4]MDH6134441.1 NAD(P)H-dependent FMN reductase [Kitasatospora sp. MAA4]